MLINAGTLAIVRQGLQASFIKGLQSNPSVDVASIATVIGSQSDIENYPMTAFLDTIRKWVGPRQIGLMTGKKLAVTNDDYEASIGIPLNNIKDDKIGIYAPVAEGKGRQCKALWIKLAIDALCANGKWLDGNAFFYATRKFNKATINNLTTDALSATTYATAYTAMMSYVGYDGEPLEIIPDTLVVGPANMETAKKIVGNAVIVESKAGDTDDATIINHVAGPNPWNGTAKLIVHPRLVGTSANYWFLLSTTGVLMPILVQKREEGPLVALDRPTDPNIFFGTTDGGKDSAVPGGVVIYGAHYRGAAALALPHLAYGGLAT